MSLNPRLRTSLKKKENEIQILNIKKKIKKIYLNFWHIRIIFFLFES